MVRCSKECGAVQKMCKPCKKVGLKGETSNELIAGCGFEFNRVRPRS